jgi:soluble lytic murein transglycosylase-like protein
MHIKTVSKYLFASLNLWVRLLVVSIGFVLCMAGAGLKANASASAVFLPSPKPHSIVEVSVTTTGMKLPAVRPKSIADMADYPDYLLKPSDIDLYKEVFSLYRKGEFSKAQNKVDQLNDRRLMGYVEHLKLMHPTAHRSTYVELRDWLKLYSDHTGAESLYELAEKRRPKNYVRPKKPKIAFGTSGALDRTSGAEIKPYISEKSRSRAQKSEVKTLVRNVRRNLLRNAPTQAWTLLNTDKNKALLDFIEFDILRADIAQSYYLNGKLDEALSHASQAVMRSGSDAPLAGWVAGLVSWRKGAFEDAAVYFETVAMTKRSSPWMITAGAYWAARSFEKLRDRRERKKMLRIAAEHPYTFYGLMANKALRVRNMGFEWDLPKFSDGHFEKVSQNKIGKRAIGLIQIGENLLAEEELRQINVAYDNGLKKALLAVAGEWNMPALALQIGSGVTGDDGRLIDAALYPVLPWAPENGYEIDRALIHAFVRQESRFDPKAKSHSGAVGLMQMMPTTASYVAGKRSSAYKSRAGQRELSDPEYNLSLGQKYIGQLLRDGRVNEDLLKLAVAYNAGPGRLGRWMREIDFDNDPLLLIESIPSAETRAFVERVMANYWIYRTRMGQDTPSLNAIVKDLSPTYVAQDIPSRMQIASDSHLSFN